MLVKSSLMAAVPDTLAGKVAKEQYVESLRIILPILIKKKQPLQSSSISSKNPNLASFMTLFFGNI